MPKTVMFKDDSKSLVLIFSEDQKLCELKLLEKKTSCDKPYLDNFIDKFFNY